MTLITLLLSQMAFALNVSPAPFPVFLKAGFSSILEFDEAPAHVVLGDQNLFQIEKLNRSVVIKPLTDYATTNMFVYFRSKETRLFILTASEENEPTFFKKFTSLTPIKSISRSLGAPRTYARKIIIRKSTFEKRNDYLTIDIELTADSSTKISPDWDRIRLKHKNRYVTPSKLWSERREIQRDSSIKSRLIFIKPNVPIDMRDVSLIVPIKGATKPFTLALKANQR